MRNLGRSQLGGSLLGSSHDCSQMSAGASEGSLRLGAFVHMVGN